MKQGCNLCGGPLFRGKCFVKHPAKRRERVETRPVEDGTLRYDHSIRWQHEFLSARGMPLNVAVWRAYRISGPHSMLIWPRAA